MPKGGFGNLIALPLQKKARDVGNSVFVNEELIAYEDQWAFLAWGQMEVDFLFAPAKLVIELDGAQHLNSVDAYRRDRRKDALLQENGYMVLRFLTEDLGKHLDEVLDTILRMLSFLKTAKSICKREINPP